MLLINYNLYAPLKLLHNDAEWRNASRVSGVVKGGKECWVHQVTPREGDTIMIAITKDTVYDLVREEVHGG